GVYEFTGAMVADPGFAPPEGPPPTDKGKPDVGKGGEPVDLFTGLLVVEKTDLVLSDVLPIVLTRTYRPRALYQAVDGSSRPFGIGTSHPYEMFLVGDRSPYTFVEIILPDGGRLHYDRISPGTSFEDAMYEH